MANDLLLLGLGDGHTERVELKKAYYLMQEALVIDLLN